MHPLLLQSVTDEATGEFDPFGTLLVLVIIAAAGYAAYKSYQRYQAGSGRRWLAGIVVCGGLAVLFSAAFVLNLAAAVGLV